MKAVFWMGIMVSANSLFTFQAVTNLSAPPTYLRFGLFCNFFGDFLTETSEQHKGRILVVVTFQNFSFIFPTRFASISEFRLYFGSHTISANRMAPKI